MAKFHINGKGEAGACKATKGGCPFGDEKEHYTSAEAARAAFEESMENAPKATSEEATQVDSGLRAVIDGITDNEEYYRLKKPKVIALLSTPQWQTLTDEQEAKTQSAVTAFEDAQRKTGYSRDDESDLDFMQFAAVGNMDAIEKRVDRLKAESEENSSPYLRSNYEKAERQLARLGKLVKPGEEKKHFEERKAQYNTVTVFEDAVETEKEKLKFLKAATENSKRADAKAVAKKLESLAPGANVRQIHESGGLSFYHKDEDGIWVRTGDYTKHASDKLTGRIIFEGDAEY